MSETFQDDAATGPYDLTESRVERLARLVSLADGWLDGEGAAVTVEAAAVTVAVLSFLPPAAQDRIMLAPTEDGGIALERVEVPRALICDVLPDGRIEGCLVEDATRADAEYRWTGPQEAAATLLALFGDAS